MVTGRQARALRLDRARRLAYLAGHALELPPREFALLSVLVAHPGEPVPAQQLAREAWPDSPWATPADVWRHIYRLRRLLGDQQRRRPLIRNRRGFGYVLDLPLEKVEAK